MAPDLLDLFVGARQANGSVSEPSLPLVDGDRQPAGGEDPRAAGLDARPVAGFERSQALFARLLEWAAGETVGLSIRLEARLVKDGRELARQVLQDQFDLRAVLEPRVGGVIGAEGMARRSVERGHERDLHTVFGEVRVGRLAYRRRGEENLYVADGTLNLPEEKHSHGVRRLIALEAPRGSFEDATDAIRRRAACRSANARSKR